MDDGEAAFAAHPLASPREDTSIVEGGGLVEQDASAVDRARKRHLVRVEIVKRRISPDLVGLVTQDIEKRVGSKEDVGFRGEVWRYQSTGGRELGLIRPTVHGHKRLVSRIHGEGLVRAGGLSEVSWRVNLQLCKALHALMDRPVVELVTRSPSQREPPHQTQNRMPCSVKGQRPGGWCRHRKNSSGVVPGGPRGASGIILRLVSGIARLMIRRQSPGVGFRRLCSS